MTTYAPGYRLTLYAPRSVDATEATVLTPAAGAPHSDQFKITTFPALAGYKPYIAALPTVRTGLVDQLTKRTSVGQMIVRLMDPPVPGAASNLKRWLTAFFGDVGGRPRMMGLKALAEESLDGGATWSTFWTGRLRALRQVSKTTFELTIWDTRTDLKGLAFVGQPHPNVRSYAGILSLLPLGVTAPYGTLVPPPPIAGTTSFTSSLAGLPTNGALGIVFVIDASALGQRKDMLVTKELLAGILPGTPRTGLLGPILAPIPNYGGSLRAVIKWTSGALSGSTGTYLVGALGSNPVQNALHKALSITIQVLPDTGAPGYLALPAAGVTGQLQYCYRDILVGPDNPLLINDVQPVQLMSDICAGYFGFLYQPGEKRPAGKNLGDPKRVIPTSSSAFTALIADQSLFVARGIIDKPVPAGDFIEQQICQGFQLGYYIDPSAQVVPIDLRRPTSLPGVTLTDADVIAAEDFDWDQDQSSAVQRVDAKYYKDYNVLLDDYTVNPGANLPSALDALLIRIQMGLTIFDVGASDLAVDKVLTFDAQLLRAMDHEFVQFRRRDDFLVGFVEGTSRHLTQPYGNGAITAALTCRRTANVTGTNIGDLRVIQLSWLPDPATYLRGGARLMRLIERGPDGPRIHTRWLDLGSASNAATPTVGNPAAQSGNTARGATVAVTLNAAGNPCELHIAITATSVGSAPAASDPSWHFYDLVTATGTVTIIPLPPGMRLWVRGRSTPAAYDIVQQPSAWVVTASLDTTGLTAPSAPTITVIGSTTAFFTLTVGDSSLMTEIRLSQPSGGTLIPVMTLPPGANRGQLIGLDPSTTIGWDIAHTDGTSYSSRVAGSNFTTLGALLDAVAPAIASARITVTA